MTITSFSRATNWMLNTPVIRSSFAIWRPILRTRRAVSAKIRWGGTTIVASPEWTPAFSTCSDIVIATTSPATAMPSSSISFASSMNRLMTTEPRAKDSVARAR